MKPLVHLLSLTLALPSILCACGCLIVGHAAAKGTFMGFVDGILLGMAVLLPWGVLGILIGIALLAVAASRAQWRRPAAGIIATLTLASAALVLRFFGIPDDLTDLWVFTPGLVALLLSVWILLSPG